jgi:glycosyltransferase involved in cell wall biosynthesis
MLNEERSIANFLSSVRSQTRPPDEIVLVDGGSTDRTVQIVRDFIEQGMPIELHVLAGANRSRGRNRAISLAKNPIIAMSDVGSVLEPDWLERIVAPFEADPGVDVVAGYYRPVPRSVLEQAAAFALVPGPDEVDPAKFLPSGRSVAFRKEAFQRTGGYPENQSHNEDTPFALEMRRIGARFFFEPRAVALWQPRANPFSLFRQYFRYALGDGQCGFWFPHYLKAFLGLAFLLAVLAIISVFRFGWCFLAAGAATYWLRYLSRSRRRGASWPAGLISPAAVLVVDAAHICGYTTGLVQRRMRLLRRSLGQGRSPG